MLVLSRRVGQRIFIGPDIVVCITDLDGGKIKVGIEAPRHLLIEREEKRQWREAEEIRNGRLGP